MYSDVLLSVCYISLGIFWSFIYEPPLSNKHIMIDLGTGNNNKMCVSHRFLSRVALLI